VYFVFFVTIQALRGTSRRWVASGRWNLKRGSWCRKIATHPEYEVDEINEIRRLCEINEWNKPLSRGIAPSKEQRA
jgi:hypothetical protein